MTRADVSLVVSVLAVAVAVWSLWLHHRKPVEDRQRAARAQLRVLAGQLRSYAKAAEGECDGHKRPSTVPEEELVQIAQEIEDLGGMISDAKVELYRGMLHNLARTLASTWSTKRVLDDAPGPTNSVRKLAIETSKVASLAVKRIDQLGRRKG